MNKTRYDSMQGKGNIEITVLCALNNHQYTKTKGSEKNSNNGENRICSRSNLGK